MRIAVISDIHGNAVALAAVLEEIERDPVDRIVCLGDALQGGCEPRKVAETLQRIGCPIVLGNADAYVLDGHSGEAEITAQLNVVREWTLEQLGPQGLEFIKTFVPTLEVDLDGGGTMLCFHGSPRSYEEVILPHTSDADLTTFFADTDARFLTGGHTHKQWLRAFGDRTYFNPGSVGSSYNFYMPRERFHFYSLAEYAVVTASAGDVSIEFRHIELDKARLEDVARASGHPQAEEQATKYTRFRPAAP